MVTNYSISLLLASGVRTTGVACGTVSICSVGERFIDEQDKGWGNSNKILPKKNKSKRAVKLSKRLKNSSSLTTVTHGGGNMMV